MAAFTKVVIAGATGNLGPAILEQLLAANFESVTVFTRPGSKHTFPAGATVVEVDYTSIPALTAALKGQDAVVSTLNDVAKDAQLNLIEAAAQAGVQRYLPSEFGCNTLVPKTAELPVFAGGKVVVQKALKEKVAAGSGLSYTLVLTGPFLDWGLMVPFLLNAKAKSAALYDGGERRFSTTTLADIGRAVVGVFKNPEATKNRAVYVQSAATTLKELVAAGKKATGKPEEWTETVVKVDDVLAEAFAGMKGGEDPAIWAVKFISVGIFGEGYGMHFDKLDNDLLGVKELSPAELEALVARYV